MFGTALNILPKPDKVLTDIADYVARTTIKGSEAYGTARYCLMDTLGCGSRRSAVRPAPSSWDRSCPGPSCRRCVENNQWSRDYLDPNKRSIANAVQVFFSNDDRTRQAVVEYPLGHRRRRDEGIPLLVEKFKINLARRFPAKQCQTILELCLDQERLEHFTVNEFTDLFVI